MYFIIKLLVISVLTLECWCQNTVTITIEEGQVTGQASTTSRSYKSYYSFHGIPYAQPPVGNLRFQPPKAIEPWSGVVDATYAKSICYQVTSDSAQESEDCLVVNVFTPEVTCTSSLLPVMVFIHGGGFNSGNAGWMGEQFIIENDIVVVSVQYRLGPFGFFTTGDTVIPGNNGLKDQQLALQWVQKNIQHFCGDPKQVTIFGGSAGAASVSYQLLSSKATGLFKAAIMQSGSALVPWAYQRDQKSITFQTAAVMNPTFATSTDSSALLSYLLTVDAKSIDSASATVYGQGTVGNQQFQQGFYYAPVIEVNHDDAFITESMYASFKAGNFAKVPVLLGINAEEYLTFSSYDGMKYNLDSFSANTSLFVPHDMHATAINAQLAGNEIKNYYNIYTTGNNYDATQEARGVVFYSDTCFGRAIIKQAELQSKYVDTFFYIFSYDGQMGGYSGTLAGTGNVVHGEESNYLFNAYVNGVDNTVASNFPQSDVTTQTRLIKMWTNFAKYNNPTPEQDSVLENVIWPKVSSNPIEYLDINTDLKAGTGPKGDMPAFWTSVYEKYGVEPYDSY